MPLNPTLSKLPPAESEPSPGEYRQSWQSTPPITLQILIDRDPITGLDTGGRYLYLVGTVQAPVTLNPGDRWGALYRIEDPDLERLLR